MVPEGDDSSSSGPAAWATAATPTGRHPRGLPGVVERLAWRPFPTNSRRFYLVLATVTAVSLTVSGGIAAWASARIQNTVDTTRDTGLGLATDTAAFRTNLATADVGAATDLLAGGTGVEAETSADYEDSLHRATLSLSHATLAGTEDDAEGLALLSDGVRTYTRLLGVSEANARQGYPVATTYLTEARSIVHDDLGPRADSIRRTGEQRVARSANLVGGPLGIVAVGALGFAVLVLVGTSILMAGRSRRVTHPAGLFSLALAVTAFAVVATSLLAQGHQLRVAATTDINRYIEANNAAAVLSQLRATELSAVAAYGTGEPEYEEFRETVDGLISRLDGHEDRALLYTAIFDYRGAVRNVQRFDLDHRNHAGAVQSTLNGRSATSYNAASEIAGLLVLDSAAQLDDRFASAQAASVAPAVPAALGTLAGAAAATLGLRRARGYR